jgi:hypothetical protein
MPVVNGCHPVKQNYRNKDSRKKSLGGENQN